MVSTQSQYSPWHLLPKNQEKCYILPQGEELQLLPPLLPLPTSIEGSGPAPVRNRGKKSTDGFVEPAAPPGTADAEALGPQLPTEQAKIQVVLWGTLVRGDSFNNIITLFSSLL